MISLPQFFIAVVLSSPIYCAHFFSISRASFTQNEEFSMPSGSKICRRTYAEKRSPETSSATAASTSWQRLYSQRSPGSNKSGSCARYFIVCTVGQSPPVSFFARSSGAQFRLYEKPAVIVNSCSTVIGFFASHTTISSPFFCHTPICPNSGKTSASFVFRASFPFSISCIAAVHVTNFEQEYILYRSFPVIGVPLSLSETPAWWRYTSSPS